MNPSKNYIDLVKASEGLRLKAYQDTGGIWTIGFGHTGKDVTPGKVITNQEAEDLLLSDSAEVVEYANSFSNICRMPLNQNQFDALCDLLFNFGIGHFQDDRYNHFLNDIIMSDPNDPVIKKVWAEVGIRDRTGTIQSGLKTRRLKEIKLYFTPII